MRIRLACAMHCRKACLSGSSLLGQMRAWLTWKESWPQSRLSKWRTRRGHGHGRRELRRARPADQKTKRRRASIENPRGLEDQASWCIHTSATRLGPQRQGKSNAHRGLGHGEKQEKAHHGRRFMGTYKKRSRPQPWQKVGAVNACAAGISDESS
jgi:hypothetical protein